MRLWATRCDTARMQSTTPRVRDLLQRASAMIERVDAEWLLAHALDRPPGWLWAHADDAVEAPARERYEALLARRAAGEPVAYLTGTQGFWSLDLRVTPATLAAAVVVPLVSFVLINTAPGLLWLYPTITIDTTGPVAVLAASGNVVTLGSTAGAVAHDAVAAPVVSVVSANSTSSKNRSLPDAAGLRLLYATA